MSTGHIFLLVLLVIVALAAALAWDKVVAAFRAMRGFFSEVNFEMGKVTWPSTDEVINSTVLVFIVTIALTVMVMVVDGVFARIFGLLLLGGGGQS